MVVLTRNQVKQLKKMALRSVTDRHKVQELTDGVDEFRDKLEEKAADVDTRQIDDALDTLDAVQAQAKTYTSYTGTTDGVVLKVDNLAFRQALGMTSKSPRWAIAYKYKADRARTLLRAVTYQVGRTGVVTPVANMDPVLLAGTIVKRASLHNEDMIEKLDLHIGDFVFVENADALLSETG